MDALLAAGALVLGLALVGFIAIVRVIFGARDKRRGPAVLDDAEKLAIAHEVIYRFFGSRMPADLMSELAAMRGLPPSPREATEAPLTASIAIPSSSPAPIAAWPPAPPERASEQQGPSFEDDRPLSPAPDVAAAAAHAHPLLRSFLSFENIIFLLGACLVLGGTLYVVAISWGHVPGHWQYLFLEAVVLFYGLALLGSATLVDRRLHLTPAAGFLSATSGVIIVAAAVVAVAAFIQHIPAGLIGGALVAGTGTGVARTVLRIAGLRTWSAPVFGLSLLLLAGAGGLVAIERPAAAGALLLAATASACALWIALIDRPPLAILSLAAAVPLGAVLIPVAGMLRAPFVAPALVAAGALAGGLGHLVGGLHLALLVVALQMTAFGIAGPSIGHAAATALVGLPIALGLAWRAPLGPDAGHRSASDGRPIGTGLTGALWLVLALLWARALGLIDPGDLGGQAWAWSGAAALPFALLPFVAIAAEAAVPGAEKNNRLLAISEITGWAIVGVALGGALAPLVASAPHATVGAPSVAVGLGAAALAHAWARQRGARARGGDPRWLVAHVLALLAIWISLRAVFPDQATMSVATAAVAMLLLSQQQSARIVGLAALPIAVITAMAGADGAPRFWLAAVLAGFGLAHLMRPMPLPIATARGGRSTDWTTRFLGPPALLAALWIALLYAGTAATPMVPVDRWPLVLALALVPMVAWVAWFGVPPFLAFQIVAAIAVLAAGGAALPGLILTCLLLVGRAAGALGMAAPAVAVLALAAIAQRAPPEPLAACLLAAGGLFFRRRLTPQLFWIRWLGPPALLAVPMTLAFYAGTRGTTRLPIELWGIVLAAAMAPFAADVVWRNRSGFLRMEILVAAWLLAVASFVAAFAAESGSRAAILAAVGAAAALAMGLGAAHRTGGGIARAGWIAALLLAPLVAAPMTSAPLRAPAALVAIAAVVGLGLVSRRQRAPDIGATAVVAGLAATLWVLAVVAKHFSTGGSPVRLLPAIAVVAALYGIAIIQRARRLADVSPAFVRGFATTTLALAAASALGGCGLVTTPSDTDVILALTGLLAVGAQALVLAFEYRRGWPFYVAECVLASGYGYLRTRTSWLDGFGDWDGVMACAGGFVCFAAERWLRRSRDQLGARESQILATVFPMLSTLLLQSSDPRAAIGMGLSAGLFLMLACLRAGALYGWLAGLLANLALLRVWVSAGIDSPFAYALPPGIALMLLSHIYRDRLGWYAGVLRTIASLLVFVSTSYEMFQFRAVWPAAALAAAAVVVILLGIHTRARAYLYLGFTALVLDIVANLTRWGMQDRLTGGVLGVGGGIVMFALGVVVARHKERVLERFRIVQSWGW